MTVLAVAAALAGAACDSLGQAMGSHQDVVARAAGHELTVDEAAGLIASNPRLPATPEVTEIIANLWVDYVLLATAARADSTLSNMELAVLLQPQFDQRLLIQLRDQVIDVDTTIGDEELMQAFQQDQPGVEVRARHILLRIPADPTAAQRDSVRNLAGQLRDRARGGADFAALATEYSADPGSAAQGGDLGFFGRGAMVAPFEEAAFALEPGEVSDVVESPFGLHVIKLEERRMPDFEDVRDQFRQQVMAQRLQAAESTFVYGITGPLGVEIQEGAAEVVRELARNPGRELGRRAYERPLVTWDGGALTAGEVLQVVRFFQRQQRDALQNAEAELIDNLLERLADNEILVQEARNRALSVSEAQQDSARLDLLTNLRQAVRDAGLLNIAPQEGETPDQAIERRVNTLLAAVVGQQQTPLMLGALSYALRDMYEAEVLQRSFPAVVEQVEENRPPEPQLSPLPQGQQPQVSPPAGTPPVQMPPGEQE
ncbi:MAG TPA: peptidylprolyl isomerase [Longimicrobiales bacterium]|nr:peptidylprolyl isomerase [Longimicrobiales bacterium]